MWIEERKNGFRMYERYTDASGVSHKISVPMQNNTRAEQKKAREAILTQLERFEGTGRRYRLKEIAVAYYAAKREELKSGTCIRNETMLDLWLSKMPNLYADELTAGRIRDSISRNWSKNTTRNSYVKTVKSFLRWAYLNDYIRDREPFDKLTTWKDTPSRDKIKDKYMEKPELDALLDAIPKPHWLLVTKILALSGMRIGELIALEVSDVDFRSREIHINKTYNDISGETTVPKTMDSVRDVHMQPQLLEVMQDAHRWHNKVCMMTGSRDKHFVLSPEGKRINYRSYKNYLKAVTLRTLGRELTPHALRHTHVALMAAKGVPLEVLSRRLGHSGTGITRDVYFHVTKDLKAADAALFDAVAEI